jgi:cytochrome c556
VCGGGQDVFESGQGRAAARPSHRRALPLIVMAFLLSSCSTGTPAARPQAIAQPAAQPTAHQLVAARFAGMHMAATLLYRGIKAAVANGSDPREQVHEAEGLELWGAAIPGLFPAGSGGEDSRARPEIWLDRADFDRRAADLRVAATRLAQLARAGDRAGFAAQADIVEGACNACHSAFRGDPAVSSRQGS